MPNQYVNKVIINDVTKLDLTGDTILPADVRSGVSFHLASGEPSVGTASLSPQITAVNYSVLPATGKQNDIAIIGGQTVTDTIISPDEPSTPSEGMVWIICARGGNTFLQINNIKIYLTSAKQYVSGNWVVVRFYVHNGTQWEVGRVYLIQDGAVTGFATFTRKNLPWKSGGSTGGNMSVTYTGTDVPKKLSIMCSSGSNSNTFGAFGIETNLFNCGEYSRLCYRAIWTNAGGANACFTISMIPTSASYVLQNNIAGQQYNSVNSDSTTIIKLPITYSNVEHKIFIGASAVGWKDNTSSFTIYDLFLE